MAGKYGNVVFPNKYRLIRFVINATSARWSVNRVPGGPTFVIIEKSRAEKKFAIPVTVTGNSKPNGQTSGRTLMFVGKIPGVAFGNDDGAGRERTRFVFLALVFQPFEVGHLGPQPSLHLPISHIIYTHAYQ